MNLGIVGLGQAGKKTLFRLLTGVVADSSHARGGILYGMADVRDPRIDALSALYRPKRTKYASFEIALPPDIQVNASRGADWIEPLRKTDAFIHVVRAFESDSVFHVEGSVDPVRDMRIVDTELLLADLDLVEKRLERIAKELKRGTTSPLQERERVVLEGFREYLEQEKPLRMREISDDDAQAVRNLNFLTQRPMIVVINCGEDLAGAERDAAPLREALAAQGATIVMLSAAIEGEMAELAEDEQRAFMADLGIAEPAAHRLSRAAYEALGLISFFTVGPDEVRAWPLRRGTRAVQAAGRIHSDLERGFIRAETIHYDDLMASGSERTAREKNKFVLNGKDYTVRDGDILNIRFNV